MADQESPNQVSEKKDKEEIPDATENDFPQELRTIIKDLPEPQQKAVKAILLGISVKRESFRSPIPPPEILKGYNEIIPKGADRILSMAEKQSDHRMIMEKTVINREQNQSGKGQNYGLVIALCFLAVSGFLIHEGHDIAGTFLGSIDLIGLVSVFIYGKYSQRKNIKDKK